MLKKSNKFKLWTCVLLHVSVCVAVDSGKSHAILLRDFNKYTDALDKIMNFYVNHVELLSTDFKIAILVVNVHLKSSLKVQQNDIMREMRARVKRTLNYCRKLLTSLQPYLDKMVGTKLLQNPVLFDNEMDWLGNLPPLRAVVTTDKKLDSQWHATNFTTYCKFINNYANGVPSPKLSDICLQQIQRNPVYRNDLSVGCRYDEKCVQALRSGSDYGYHLTHRLLHILAAHFGRNCNLLSPKNDAMMIGTFCTKIFAEAKYISRNNYGHAVDLFLEQIALCSTAGYVQFLNSTWLNDILRYQSELGCFTFPRDEDQYDEWESNELVERCAGHFSGVAAAALAPAIRYIFETLNDVYNF